MNLPVIFTLNNPMIAPIMVMVSCFIIGFGVAYIVLSVARKFYLDKRVHEYAKAELVALETQHAGDMDRISDLEDRNVALKVKIAQISLHLGKAITHAEIDG